MRSLHRWLPPTIGLLAGSAAAVLTTAPHTYTWPRLLASSVGTLALTTGACAVAMFLTYVVLPATGIGPVIRRTSAAAALFAPLVILLQQTSLWAPIVAATLVWTVLPARVIPKPQWKKFAAAIAAAVLLQIGASAWIAHESILSALILGLAFAPILWRIRQERPLPGPFQPRYTLAVALLLTILASTHLLPSTGASGWQDAYASNVPKGKNPTPGLSVGGKYRGVILSPEEQQHVTLIVPLALMPHDPFLLHQDPIGIPFFGVYWFFQPPDNGPAEDAVRVKGSPDNIAFHSADNSLLKMEAHQNLGRLIDLSSCSRIDVAIRNNDIIIGSIAIEVILVNTTRPSHPAQSLGINPIGTAPQETLAFKIPKKSPTIQQFDELTIRFPRSKYRWSRSAKIAIDRFYLVPH